MISHLHHTNVSAISKELSQQLAANGSVTRGARVYRRPQQRPCADSGGTG